MRFDRRPKDGWIRACENYRAALPVEFQDPALNIQIYQGYESALREIAFSLARLFSHKRTVAIVMDHDPSFTNLAAALSEDGFAIRELSALDLRDCSAWLPEIQSELLFVLYAKDHLVTSRLFNVEAFEDSVRTSRFHRIVVSHGGHRLEQNLSRPAPFEIRINSLCVDRALMLAGERGKIRPQVTDLLEWPTEASTAVGTLVGRAVRAGSRERIQKFESLLPNGFEPIFIAEDGKSKELRANDSRRIYDRIYDRAVFTHRGMDGSAIVDELEKLLSDLPSPEMHPPAFETASGCRWEDLRFAAWLSKTGLAPEQIRGLVVVDADYLVTDAVVDGLIAKLEQVAQIISLASGQKARGK
jgi:hypothetical protein